MYKVGDKVRVVGRERYGHSLELDKIVTIVDIVNYDVFRCEGINTRGRKVFQSVHPDDIEPTTDIPVLTDMPEPTEPRTYRVDVDGRAVQRGRNTKFTPLEVDKIVKESIFAGHTGIKVYELTEWHVEFHFPMEDD